MHILLVNDDGIDAPGLHALAKVLGKEHRVTVCAPDGQRSAAGHSITLRAPLVAEKRHVPGAQAAFAVSGTPADCTRLGLMELAEGTVNLVVSGINKGLNVAMDLLYSGTVSAALEAAMRTVKAVAVSTQWEGDFDRAAAIFGRLLSQLDIQKDIDCMLNVNIPTLPGQTLKGARWVPAGQCACWLDSFEGIKAPDGRTYYWVTEDLDMLYPAFPPDTDVACVEAGYVALTPLAFDLTDRAGMRDKKFDL